LQGPANPERNVKPSTHLEMQARESVNDLRLLYPQNWGGL
jgi:hypothetical protein